MAITTAQNSYKIVSVTHGANTYYQPVGGSLQESVDWSENRPDVSVSASAVAANTYDLTGRVRFEGMQTPVAIGTKAALTFTLLEYAGTNATVVIASSASQGMLAGPSGYEFDSAPYTQTTDFKYQGTTTAPIVVTLT